MNKPRPGFQPYTKEKPAVAGKTRRAPKAPAGRTASKMRRNR